MKTNDPLSAKTLSCIIVNYRTPALLLDCLPGLLSELSGISARIVIVDNHSADQSVSILRDWIHQHDTDSRIDLIESTHNNGFAAGNNIGLRHLSADFYLLLNSDTQIRPGAIRILLESARQHPEAGLFSPRLEWPDGKGQESCFRYHSPVSELTDAARTGLVSRLFASRQVPLPVQTSPCQPEWTSFACVMIRDQVLRQVGLLDEGYFMYFEDVEFCHRARQHGWTIQHEPAARVVHLRGGSSPVKSSLARKKRPPRYYYESRARYFYQIYGPTGPILANLAWTTGRLISMTRQLLGRTDMSAPEKQWADIWIHWRTPMQSYTHPSKASP